LYFFWFNSAAIVTILQKCTDSILMALNNLWKNFITKRKYKAVGQLFGRISRIVKAELNHHMSDEEGLIDKVKGTALVAGGTVSGAVVSASIGGMGLVGGFGGVSIGMAPVAAAGAVVGSAAYGAKKAMEEGDATAIAAAAGGAAAAAGVAASVGGMGLAFSGTAVAVGTVPVVAAGAVTGLAAYGIKKLCK
jgi:hypothetical protein